MTAETAEWREPPAKDARKRWAGIGPVMAEIAAELRSRPGEWKCVKTFPEYETPNARQMGTNINTGRYAAFRPRYHYEARTRTEVVKDPNGIDTVVVNVYACYVGTNGRRRLR